MWLYGYQYLSYICFFCCFLIYWKADCVTDGGCMADSRCITAQRLRDRRQETLSRRDELFEEPGDAVLLSDAVCSEPLGWRMGHCGKNRTTSQEASDG
jgi:hypothetical protein